MAETLEKDRPFLSGPAVSRLFPGEENFLPEPCVGQPQTERLADFPLYLAVEVTNACNLACTHCNYRHGLPHYTRERGFMGERVFRRILDESAEHKTTLLLNYDGEPMLHPDYLTYLRLVSEAGLNSYFNTNGTLMTPQVSRDICSFYTGSIFFSIDGNKKWFEKVRRPASYEQVCANVEAFLEENERRGWPVTVCINFCNLGQSAEERKEFVEKWLPRVNYVSIGETNDKYGACISQKIIDMPLKRRPVCVVPWMTCGIGHNGDVIPCSIYITRANTADAIFGNVNDASIAEIWKNEAFMRFRRRLAGGETDGTYCERCERWLSQFNFPEEKTETMIIRRNGFWTTFQNRARGSLNFMA